MQLGYTIVYVPDVAASLAFFEQAFGLQRRFLHEAGDYGELDTGATTLAFAAHALGRARGRWVEAALDSMAQSSQGAAHTLAQFGAHACTDVTGFGLLGHLVEMLQTPGLGAQLEMASLPVLDGALASLQGGIFSSLHSSNAQQSRAIAAGAGKEADLGSEASLRRELLFDPQTAGGLLASVPAAQAEACVQALKAAGYPHTAIIGRITAQGEALEPVLLKT
jgi:selenide,water dikinase